MTDTAELFNAQFVLDVKVLKKRQWKQYLSSTSFQTQHLTNGSVWTQDDDYSDEDYITKFLVKWKHLSFLHLSWETLSDLKECGKVSIICIEKFIDSYQRGIPIFPDLVYNELYPPEFRRVEKVLDFVVGDESIDHERAVPVNGVHGTNASATIQWSSLSNSFDTFEDIRDLQNCEVPYITELLNFQKSESQVSDISKSPLLSSKQMFEKLSDSTRNNMWGYQIQCIEWLIQKRNQHQNCMLSFEKGLNPYFIIYGFLDQLKIHYRLNRHKAFLFVVSEIHLLEVYDDLKKWTNMNIINYSGSVEDRKISKDHEFYSISNNELKVDCVITTPSNLKDFESDHNFKCELVIIDTRTCKNYKLIQKAKQTSFSSATWIFISDLVLEKYLEVDSKGVYYNIIDMFPYFHMISDSEFYSFDSILEYILLQDKVNVTKYIYSKKRSDLNILFDSNISLDDNFRKVCNVKLCYEKQSEEQLLKILEIYKKNMFWLKKLIKIQSGHSQLNDELSKCLFDLGHLLRKVSMDASLVVLESKASHQCEYSYDTSNNCKILELLNICHSHASSYGIIIVTCQYR